MNDVEWYINLQHQLADEWNTAGPERAKATVESLTHEQLVTLVMLNAGRQALLS